MTTVGKRGRLGNHIFRNLAVSMFAEKFDLYVDYYNYNLIKMLGIELFVGNKKHSETIDLTDENYFELYENENLEYNLNPDMYYYQTKDISIFLHKYLHKDEIMWNIINVNPYKNRYNTNNDLYMHIRLGDVANLNPGINYYMKTIQSIQFNHLYISTDSIRHPIIRYIRQKYPKAIIVNVNEVKTIQFASTCKHIILSHGTFSAIIGYLAFFSTIHYPEYIEDKIWYGDIFSIDGWIKHSIA